MTTSTWPARAPVRVLPATRYDRAVAWLLALLVMAGAAAFCLLMIWLALRYSPPRPVRAVPLALIQPSGGQEGQSDERLRLEAPPVAEVAAESDLDEPALAVRTVVSLDALGRAAQPDDTDTDGEGGNAEPGGEDGTRDRRSLGPLGNGPPGYPPHERWKIEFPAGWTLDEYARTLDYFGIELGVLEGDEDVAYAAGLSDAAPRVALRPRADESRLFFAWTAGTLRAADEQLLRRAGIEAAGRQVLHFYTAELEQELLRLEHEYAGRDAIRIRRTTFAVRADGDGFRFEVVKQVER